MTIKHGWNIESHFNLAASFWGSSVISDARHFSRGNSLCQCDPWFWFLAFSVIPCQYVSRPNNRRPLFAILALLKHGRDLQELVAGQRTAEYSQRWRLLLGNKFVTKLFWLLSIVQVVDFVENLDRFWCVHTFVWSPSTPTSATTWTSGYSSTLPIHIIISTGSTNNYTRPRWIKKRSTF